MASRAGSNGFACRIWPADRSLETPALQHKKAVIKTLLCRAERLTSSEANYKEEINRVQLTLKNNGYPPALTTLSQISNNTKKTIANRSSAVLPYYRGLTDKLQRCLSNHKIKAFFKPMRTIGDKLRNGKDPAQLLNVKARCIAYRVVIVTKSTLGKQKGHSTHARKNILTISDTFIQKKCPCSTCIRIESSNELVKNSVCCFWERFQKKTFYLIIFY